MSNFRRILLMLPWTCAETAQFLRAHLKVAFSACQGLRTFVRILETGGSRLTHCPDIRDLGRAAGEQTAAGRPLDLVKDFGLNRTFVHRDAKGFCSQKQLLGEQGEVDQAHQVDSIKGVLVNVAGQQRVLFLLDNK